MRASPSIRRGEDGEIVFAGETTFPGYSGTKLGRIVRETMQLPVLVENDVNAAALGEVWRGAARGASSAFMITVGTNLGGCFVQQGRIWHGASFSAGEIGYLRLHNEKRILEDVASTRAMIREAAFSHNMSLRAHGRDGLRLGARRRRGGIGGHPRTG